MSQSGDKNKSSMGSSKPSFLVLELRVTIVEMLKEALSDNKDSKGKQKSSNSEGRMS